MFERMARGWALTRQSGAVLLADKRLIIFPLMSLGSLLLVLASFLVPTLLLFDWNEAVPRHARFLSAYAYVALFGFYFANYTIMAFFNCALVSCAMSSFDGKEVSLKAGLNAALSRWPQIAAWSFVSATVGVILRAIAERSGLLGRLATSLVGMAWGIATYFAVPVLVVEGLGPIDLVRRSTELVKKTWGESLTANATIGAISGLAMLGCLIPGVLGFVFGVSADSPALMLAGLGATVLLAIAVSVVLGTMNTIVLAATYRLAANGAPSSAFDADLLMQAFRPKSAL